MLEDFLETTKAGLKDNLRDFLRDNLRDSFKDNTGSDLNDNTINVNINKDNISGNTTNIYNLEIKGGAYRALPLVSLLCAGLFLLSRKSQPNELNESK